MENPSQVVDDLYRVFSPYRIGDEILGCTHCVTPQDSHLLVTKPLASLTVSDLDRYAFKSMTTWGSVNDFKYFLPRLFELVLREGIHSFGMPETLFGKLKYGGWTDWPLTERKAIDRFLDAFWLSELRKPVISKDDDAIDTAICALGQACDELDRFLTVWCRSSETNAVRQLAQVIWINADVVLRKNHLMNSFWEGRPGAQQILSWLKSDAVQSVIDHRSNEFTDHLEYVPQQLEAIRAVAT